MVLTPPRLLDAGLLVSLCVASALAYPTLPARIPTHFGFDGVANAWSATSPASWYALPLVALGLAVFLHLLPSLFSRYPAVVHLSNGRDLRSVPDEHRPLVVSRLRDLLDWVAVLCTSSLCLLQWVVHRTAVGGSVGGVLLALLLIGPIILLLSVIFTRRIEADLRAATQRP